MTRVYYASERYILLPQSDSYVVTNCDSRGRAGQSATKEGGLSPCEWFFLCSIYVKIMWWSGIGTGIEHHQVTKWYQ